MKSLVYHYMLNIHFEFSLPTNCQTLVLVPDSLYDLGRGPIMPMSKLPEIVSNIIFGIFKFHNLRSKFARTSMFTDTQSHRNTHTGSDRHTHIVAMMISRL